MPRAKKNILSNPDGKTICIHDLKRQMYRTRVLKDMDEKTRELRREGARLMNCYDCRERLTQDAVDAAAMALSKVPVPGKAKSGSLS